MNGRSSLVALGCIWLWLSPSLAAQSVEQQISETLELSVAVNDSAAATIRPGWPLLLEVYLTNTGSGPLQLAPRGAAWPQALEVKMADAPDGVVLPFALTQPSPGNLLTLPPAAVTSYLMALSGAATAALSTGAHRLQASYVISDGDGWHGKADAEVVLVVAEPGVQIEGEVLQLALLTATIQAAQTHYDEAAQTLRGYLANDPNAIPALALMAEALEAKGDTDRAYLYAAAALAVYDKSKDAWKTGEPPVRLLQLRKRLWTQVLAATPDTAPAQPLPAAAPAPASMPDQTAPVQATLPAIIPVPVSSAPSGPSPQAAGVGSSPGPVRPDTTSPAPASVAASSSPSDATSTTPAPGTVVSWDRLKEADILKEANGQWASAATASTQYRPEDYSAKQATGVPDVPSYADNRYAWTPSTAERQAEWLELVFAKPVHATEVRVRQSFNPGTIVKVEAVAADGAIHLLWSGRDPNNYPKNQVVWFVVRFPQTDYPVQRVRLTLDTPAAKGWKQIDAVQLVGGAD
jgi:hypothetical protein